LSTAAFGESLCRLNHRPKADIGRSSGIKIGAELALSDREAVHAMIDDVMRRMAVTLPGLR
jgi:hypothetical protein